MKSNHLIILLVLVHKVFVCSVTFADVGLPLCHIWSRLWHRIEIFFMFGIYFARNIERDFSNKCVY